MKVCKFLLNRNFWGIWLRFARTFELLSQTEADSREENGAQLVGLHRFNCVKETGRRLLFLEQIHPINCYDYFDPSKRSVRSGNCVRTLA